MKYCSCLNAATTPLLSCINHAIVNTHIWPDWVDDLLPLNILVQKSVSFMTPWVCSPWVICAKQKWVFKRDKWWWGGKCSTLASCCGEMTHRVHDSFIFYLFWFQKARYIRSRALYSSVSYRTKNNQQQQMFKDTRGGEAFEAEETLKWAKLYHNSVLQVLFLGVLQSCLHMKHRERQVQTFLSLSAITWTRC